MISVFHYFYIFFFGLLSGTYFYLPPSSLPSLRSLFALLRGVMVDQRVWL